MKNTISFIDNNLILGWSFINRDYSLIESTIKDSELTYSVTFSGCKIGYNISINMPLTRIYGFTCYVVKFTLENIPVDHNDNVEKAMKEMCLSLKHEIDLQKGYYNLRLPSHVIDLIRSFNDIFHDTIMCGSTIEYVTNKKNDLIIDNDINLFYADKTFFKRNEDILKNNIHKSFENYRGQYHISRVLRSKAAEIYSNWINDTFNNGDRILVATINDKIAGCITVRETELGTEAVLGYVDNSFRQRGVYKALISKIINDAIERNGVFVTSTQIDNIYVQKTWASLGMFPFYSIYNIHCSNL